MPPGKQVPPMLDVVKHYEDGGAALHQRPAADRRSDARHRGGAGVTSMPSRAAMVTIKRPEEVARMRHAGLILVDVLDALQSALAPASPLPSWTRSPTTSSRAPALFLLLKGYGSNPPFPASICASINDEVVHGMSRTGASEGDVVSLDVGCIWQGWHADCARTWFVGTPPPRVAELIDATRRGMEAGIAAAVPGNRLGDVGAANEAVANERGYDRAVVRRPRHRPGHARGPAGGELRLPRAPACGSRPACASPSSRCSTLAATRWLCWTMVDGGHRRRGLIGPLREHHRRHRSRPGGPSPSRDGPLCR